MSSIKSFLWPIILVLSAGGGHAGSHDDAGYQVFVQSACAEDMRLAVRYLSPGQDWQSDHWWDLPANHSTFLTTGGERLLHQAGLKKLYMYAETVTGRGHFHTQANPGDENLIKIRDYRYMFARPVRGSFDGDTFQVTLQCNDS